MPHITVEYSANVCEIVDIDDLLRAVHTRVLETGAASVSALRTRAVARDQYVIADGNVDNMFIAVIARLAPRSHDDRQLVLGAIVEAIDGYVGEEGQRLMISVELQQIDPEMRVNKNFLRAVMEQSK